jgi:N-methylhydantoinase B/oxoprolinase/acetone carboxylase alpha subunit
VPAINKLLIAYLIMTCTYAYATSTKTSMARNRGATSHMNPVLLAKSSTSPSLPAYRKMGAVLPPQNVSFTRYHCWNVP